MAELVRAVEQHLCAGSVRTSCAVRRLTWDGARYSLEAGDETLQADAVILATPSDVSAHLLAGVDVEVAGLLAEIRYAPAATVSLGFRTRDLAARPEGHGYVIPRREGRPVLAVTWSSNKFAGRAPAGHLLVRGFFGQPESAEAVRAEDSELVRLLQAELRSTAGIAADPVVSAVHRWPNAMPQYAVGHPERIAAIEHELASHPGLALAGAAYRGVGIPDCIQSGRRAADLVLDCVTRGMR
jgi:oxygen-dependent protoporphyrinogen oxidase